MSNNKKMTMQLGMPQGTASHRLRKMILFKLLQEADLNWCYRCGKKIEKIKDLSIEHKIPWLDSEKPKELFFDLKNVAFSHLSCNCAFGNSNNPYKHPSANSYKNGCRCSECTEIQKLRARDYATKRKIENPMYRRKI